jgi:hypothetical protein
MTRQEEYRRQQSDKNAAIEKKRSERWWIRVKEPISFFTFVLAVATIALTVVAVLQLCALDNQIRSLELTERAYVFLNYKIEQTFVSKNFRPGHGAALYYTFRNSGKTPSTFKSIPASIRYFKSGHPEYFELGDETAIPPSGIVFPPNGEGPTFEFSAKVAIADDEIVEARAGRGKIYFWGKLEYADVFGSKHETGFCWEYNFRGNDFSISQSKLNYQN